jgi:hypothetical protein
MKFVLTLLLALILSLTFVAAVTVDSVDVDSLTPGKEGVIRVIVENKEDVDLEDVTMNLIFAGIPFSPVGSSSESINELDEDDDEKFTFRIRVANNVAPGDYEIPYTIRYKEVDSDVTKKTSATIGVRVTGQPELVFSVSGENAIENSKGKVSLKIVNKGFSDARFASVRIVSNDFVLLSDEQVYIGTVDSDDFETAEFDVLFDRNPAIFRAVLEYKDFDNKDRTERVELPLTIYSKEDALRLGITKKSNGPAVLGLVLVLIIVISVWRTVKRRKRLRRSLNRN